MLGALQFFPFLHFAYIRRILFWRSYQVAVSNNGASHIADLYTYTHVSDIKCIQLCSWGAGRAEMASCKSQICNERYEAHASEVHLSYLQAIALLVLRRRTPTLQVNIRTNVTLSWHIPPRCFTFDSTQASRYSVLCGSQNHAQSQ